MIAILVVLLLAMVALAGWKFANTTNRTNLERAVAAVPASTKRLTFTDWAQLRTDLGGARPDALDGFLRQAYDRDLSLASSIEEAGPAVQRNFGFGPANANWETYAQSDQGAVMVLSMDDDADFERIRANLRDAGFDEPANDDGVWTGGPDVLAAIDVSITPELGYLVLLESEGLVLTSDSSDYVAQARDVANGDADSVADAVDSQVAALGDPASAYVWRGDFVCSDLGMSSAGADDQQRAKEQIAAAGGVGPLDGAAVGMGVDREVTVAMRYESPERAEADVRARGDLFVGPDALGIGSLADTFELDRLRTEGNEVLLTASPKEPTGQAISALASGPQLLMTC